MLKKMVFLFFRILLGFLIIGIFIKNMSEINTNKLVLLEHVEAFEKNILVHNDINTDLNLIKEHPLEILYFENICLIYGGFLLIFGFSMAKAFILLGLLIEFIFINNIYFKRDQDSITHFSLLLSIYGAALNIQNK
jgi:hypothetical protein